MNLDNQALKKYFKGTVSFEEYGDYLLPRRFTEKQFDRLLGQDFLLVRSKMTAGVILDFQTDAPRVSFDAIFLETSRNYYAFDIFVNGTLKRHFGEGGVTNGTTRHFETELGEGEKSVQIFFPPLFETGIKNFRAPSASFITACERKRKFLFFGDSITHGYATKLASMTYANILTRLFDADSINQAIAGDVFNADNLDKGLDFNPDTVFVAYGTNDWRGGRDVLVTAEGYFKKLNEIYRGKKIFVILPIYRMD